MFTKEIEGEAYGVDPKKLKQIQFPFFLPWAKNAFYTESDKLVYLPIRFQFMNANDLGADLKGQLLLPKDYAKIEASAHVSMDIIFSALYDAIRKDHSIIDDASMKIYMNAIAERLYHTLTSYGDSFIPTNTKYEYPSFIVKDKQIIGVSNYTIFQTEGKDLKLNMQHLSGTYLSSFHSEKDKDVFAVILNEEGEKIIAARIHIDSAEGHNLEAYVTKIYRNIEPFVSVCQDVYNSYHEEYLNYFLDKEDNVGEEEDFDQLFE